MIRKIKFSNFYSFQQEQEIDFLAKKKKTYDYFNSKSGDQITKIAGFIGGNASGKTNVMRFLSFLSYFICISKKEDEINYYQAFKTFFNNNKVSNFYIEFEKNNFIYFYDFSIKNNIIITEKLSLKEIKKKARKKEIFTRDSGEKFSLNKKFFVDFPEKSLKNIRPDVSFIAFIRSNYNVEIINNVFNYFNSFKTNINEKGEMNNSLYQSRILDLYIKDEKLKKEMDDFVKHFDIGLSSFDIKKKITKEEDKQKPQISVQGVHNTKGVDQKLDFGYESRGTQSLFFTLANILHALKNNHVVIIDEIERGLHPEALNKIISYFIDENHKGNAQLIFSSHSLGFMNKLDMHQIFLVEKNENCQSSMYRLNQVDTVRTDDNFLSKYMTGAYGAFPKIRV
jgi:uncharacterized protein